MFRKIGTHNITLLDKNGCLAAQLEGLNETVCINPPPLPYLHCGVGGGGVVWGGWGGGGGGDSVQFTDFANFAWVHDLPLASFRCERIKGKPIFGFRTFLPSPKKV